MSWFKAILNGLLVTLKLAKKEGKFEQDHSPRR